MTTENEKAIEATAEALEVTPRAVSDSWDRLGTQIAYEYGVIDSSRTNWRTTISQDLDAVPTYASYIDPDA